MTALPVISPDLFGDLVRELHRGPSTPTWVSGSVDLSNSVFERNLLFENITFEGDFHAADATFQSLTFRNCEFHRDLVLSSIRARGNLVLQGCTFVLDDRGLGALRVDLTDSRIEGSVSTKGKVAVAGGVSFARAKIDGDLTFELLEITGDDGSQGRVSLSLNGAKVGGSLLFRKHSRWFGGGRQPPLQLASALDCGGLEVRGDCSFDHELQLSGEVSFNRATIGGRLNLKDFTFEAKPPKTLKQGPARSRPRRAGRPSVNLTDLVCNGGLQLSNLEDCGGIDLSRSRLASCSIEQIDFSSDDRTFTSGRLLAANLDVAGSLSLTSVRGLTTLSLFGSKAKSLELSKIIFRGAEDPIPGSNGIDVSAFQCAASASFDQIRNCTSLASFGARFDYMLILSNFTREKGAAGRLSLRLDATYVAVQTQIHEVADLDLITIHLSDMGSVLIGAYGPVSCGSLLIARSNFRADVRVCSTSVTDIAREGDLSAGLTITSSTLKGGLSFHSARPDVREIEKASPLEQPGWREADRTTVYQTLAIRDCEIGGNLNLSRIRVGYDATEAQVGSGQVLVSRTNCGGDILCASALSLSESASYSIDDRARISRAADEIYRSDASSANRLVDRAICGDLSLEQCRAAEVDLSGLELRVRSDQARRDESGFVRAADLEAQGFSAVYTDGLGRSAAAIIPRALDLAGSTIGTLQLSSAGFDDVEGEASGGRRRGARTPPRAKSVGIVLERASIRTLHVPRHPACSGPDCFPRPLDLAGLQVQHWLFSNDLNGQPHANDFLDFLDNDEVVHRELYRSISLLLRNNGHDDDADQVEFAEEYRARWEPRGLWRKGHGRLRFHRIFGIGMVPKRKAQERREVGLSHPRDWFWRLKDTLERRLFRYYRNPAAVFGVILVLMLASVPFAAAPENFELSDSARQIIAEQGQALPTKEGEVWSGDGVTRGLSAERHGGAIGPPKEEWGIPEAAWMIARYHIPIINLAARGEYVATNDNPLTGPLGPSLIGNAEDWFTAMSILNWLMWPLLLTFVLRKMLRDR